jgi:hypothetical protein
MFSRYGLFVDGSVGGLVFKPQSCLKRRLTAQCLPEGFVANALVALVKPRLLGESAAHPMARPRSALPSLRVVAGGEPAASSRLVSAGRTLGRVQMPD